MTRTLSILLTISALLLTACGNPWPGESPPPPPPPLNPDSVQELVGGEEPEEQPIVALKRIITDIGRRASHLLISDGYIEGVPVPIKTTCERKTCTFDLGNGNQTTVTTETLLRPSSSGSNAQAGSGGQSGSGAPQPGRNTNALFSAEGITLLETPRPNSSIFYAALNHSAFGIIRMISRDGGRKVIFAGAYGDRLTSRPAVSGLWKGQMTGVTKGGQRDFLQGTAHIQYTSSDTGGDISADFYSVKNLSQNRDYSGNPVFFLNVPVESDGSFLKEGNNKRIDGAFYGKGHAEATGIFETPEMLGAFGTKVYPPKTVE